jgi:hypothetical protein
MTNLDDLENRATKQLIAVLRECLNEARVSFVIQANGLTDTPSEDWVLARALLMLSDEFAELAVK